VPQKLHAPIHRKEPISKYHPNQPVHDNPTQGNPTHGIPHINPLIPIIGVILIPVIEKKI
jgi:hypothetical protein